MKAPLTERVAGKRNLRTFSLRFKEIIMAHKFDERESWVSRELDNLIDRVIEYDKICPALRRGVQ